MKIVLTKKYSGIKLFTIAQLIATMSSRTAARLLAISQARSKMEELTKKEVVSFAFILTDDGPELIRDWDVFRLYKNQNLTREMMDIVRGRHKQYSKHSIFYFKEKIINCYRLRLGVEHFANYHMRLSKEEIEERKQARLRDEHHEQEARKPQGSR